jgi:class 3 adenylate cyclase/tetratricopeptide (TPR) repeat protein
MEGERRLASILFCDVQGSTAMAEKLDPEEWAEIMDEAFDFLIAPVVRYGGTVARLLGDGLLALFGAPQSHEDDPQRAILAGLDILEGIRPFKEKFQNDYGMDFNVRIGINTGMVVVGEIGSSQAAEWTAMGDAVNLAARMEQIAMPDSIQIGEDTYRLTAPLFDFEPLGAVEIRGKREPVKIYRVLKPKDQPGRLRGIPGLETPLRGRSAEIETLRKELSYLHQGRGGITCLIGDAGLGKSRLIQEIYKDWQLRKGESERWIEGKGISFEASRPYGLFRQLLFQSCGVADNESVESAQHKILCVLEPWSVGREKARDETQPALELLLSSEEDLNRKVTLEGEALKRQIFHEASSIFFQLATSGPLVVVCDDLHWADPVSVELLLHLFQFCEDYPIHFLCAMRPQQQTSGWQVKQAAEREYPHRYTEIELLPLSGMESSALVDDLLAISDLPDELRQLILGKAEGNPLFVEEIVRDLIDSKVVVHDKSDLHWHAARQIEEVRIPDTLHALLAARIDRLDLEARQTLQLASVIGRVFPFPVLKKILDPDFPLDRQLNTLERLGLVAEVQRMPERQYAFRHELTRDAAYETILHRRRRQYHRRVGEAIEELYPEQVENQAHLLAMHFDKALDRERSLKYYSMAGDKAMRLYANQEAARHYRRAVQIAAETGAAERLVPLHLNLGHALQNSGKNGEALEVYRQLVSLGEERQDPAMQLAGLIPQATLRAIPSAAFDPVEGRKLTRRTLELARSLGDHSAEARSLWNMMLMEIMDGSNDNQAATFGEQALAIARQYGTKEELAYVLHDLSRVYLEKGRIQEYWTARDEAEKLWRELGKREMLADSLGVSAEAYALSGDWEKAIHSAEEGLAIARSIDNPWGEAHNLMNLSYTYFMLGDIKKSLQVNEEVYARGKQAGFMAAQFNAWFLWSWIYAVLGDPQRGLQTFKEAARARPERLLELGPGIQAGMAYFLYQSGDLQGANQTLGDVEVPSDLDMLDPIFYPFLFWYLSELALANHRPEQALDYVDRVIAHRESLGYRSMLPEFFYLRGKALLGMGQVEEGIQALERARAMADENGLRISLWMIRIAQFEAYREQQDLARAEVSRLQAGELTRFILDQIENQDLQVKFKNKYGFFL